MEARGFAQLIGDYGNPSGSGLTKLNLPDMPVEAYGDTQTKVSTFAAAVKTAQLTACNVGDIVSAQTSESLAAKPAANVNIDRKLVVTWRTKNDNSIRRITIPGVPATSTGISMTDNGERINSTGRTALEAALNAAYGIEAPDGAVVLTGKVLQSA